MILHTRFRFQPSIYSIFIIPWYSIRAGGQANPLPSYIIKQDKDLTTNHAHSRYDALKTTRHHWKRLYFITFSLPVGTPPTRNACWLILTPKLVSARWMESLQRRRMWTRRNTGAKHLVRPQDGMADTRCQLCLRSPAARFTGVLPSVWLPPIPVWMAHRQLVGVPTEARKRWLRRRLRRPDAEHHVRRQVRRRSRAVRWRVQPLPVATGRRTHVSPAVPRKLHSQRVWALDHV